MCILNCKFDKHSPLHNLYNGLLDVIFLYVCVAGIYVWMGYAEDVREFIIVARIQVMIFDRIFHMNVLRGWFGMDGDIIESYVSRIH